MQSAEHFAKEGHIVTFGVKPNYPETGFGYICTKEEKVVNFVEKPDKQTAEKYIQDGNYFWNSGIFMFKALL